MKKISVKLLPFFVLLLMYTVIGCSKKQYPKAEYHKLTGRKARLYTAQGLKTSGNTLPLGDKQKFTLTATDSVLTYPGKSSEKIYSNYKEFFADVVPGKNYKVSVHTLPDTHTSTYKYLFVSLADVFNKQDKKLDIEIVENRWATGFEKPGLKRAFTFNSGETDQVRIVICADNRELDKKIFTFTMNFVSKKFMTAPTGDFYITIEEIKE